MDIISVNKRADFDYDILKTFEAGISLQGHEVRSAKSGRANISGAYAVSRNGSVKIIGMSIQSFQPKNAPEGYNPERVRTLLLKKEEVFELFEQSKNGLTLVPLKMYNKKGFVKVLIGIGRGRKKRDKREVIKKRETEREIRAFVKKS